MFGADFVLLFNELLFPFLIVNDELLDSDDFLFLPFCFGVSPFNESSFIVGFAKPPETN